MAKKKSKKGSKAGSTSSNITPKFGMLTNPSIDVLKEIKRAAGLGVDYIELGMEPPLGTNEILMKNRKRILAALNKNKLSAIAHSAYWGLYGSMYELVRKAWIDETKRQITVTAGLKADKFVIHARSVGMVLNLRRTRKNVLDNYVKSMKALVSHGKYKKVKIVLENMPPGGSICQPKDIKYIIDRVPGLGFHLDVGHAFMTGGNKCIREFIRKLGKRLEHVHVHDNHGLADEHLPLGNGLIDYKMVVRELKRAGYGSREGDIITLEVFRGGDRGFRSSLKKIKKLWEAT